MTTRESPGGSTGALETDGQTIHTSITRIGPPCGCPLDHHECGIDLPLPPTLPNLLASRSTWYHLRAAGLLDVEGHLERFLGSQGVA